MMAATISAGSASAAMELEARIAQPDECDIPGVSLVGPRWALVSVAGIPVVSTATALFDIDQVSGSAGCNLYRAGYESQDGDILVSSRIATTLMLCSPESVMVLERRFLQSLLQARTYEIEGGHLTLRNAAGQPVAEFIHPECPRRLTRGERR